MAPLAGLLVEYFIVGAVASLWLTPLLTSALLSHADFAKDIAPIVAATLVPAIYLVGMVCDYAGYWATRWKKEKIELATRAELQGNQFSSQQVHAFAIAYEPKLAAEMDLRSTRDRVARGSLIACLPLLALSPLGYKVWWHGTLSGLVVIVLIGLLWARMQHLSAKYEIQVIHVLIKKHGVLEELLSRHGTSASQVSKEETMTHRYLRIALLVSVAFVVAVVLFFANWPEGFLGIDRPNNAGDFGQLFSAAQSIFAGLALIGVVYTIVLQQLDLKEQRAKTDVSLELATAAALFSYYNEKISSLRQAICRDAPTGANLSEHLSVGDVAQNAAELRTLLEKHRQLRNRMEKLNKDLAPP